MRYLLLTLLFLCMATIHTYAQNNRSWEEWLETMTNTDDAESGRLEMTYEELSELENHKIDLNRCTRDELLQLPFLSAQQVMDFIEYRDRHGRIETMVELYMIRSMEKSTIDLLSHFATIYPEVVKDTLPSLKDLIKYGRHELLGTLKVPFYNRRGDENGYLGYKYKHWMRYTFTSGQHVKLGLVASQDAGEPFFAGQNRMGYDFYSFYLMLQKWGCVKRMVAGRYRLKFGLGLVMNNSFGLGKINTLATMGRSINNITPHGSRSEANYLQGIAATFKWSDVLSVTPFVSWRTIDATLNRNSSTVATLLRTGYHRTKSEMERRRNTSQSLFGTNITFFKNGWHVGITGFYTAFNRELQPTTTQLYRRWYPRGSQFWNASIDYGYLNGRLNISGETAIGNCKHIATINTLSYQLTPILTLIALQRYYPYQYYSLFSQTFAEGGAAQNESGIYIGGNLTIGRWTQLLFYTDYAWFAWPKYRISESSGSWDNMAQLSWQKNQWGWAIRYRIRTRKRDITGKKGTVPYTEQRIRAAATYNNNGWNLQTQADMALCRFTQNSFGIMLTENAGYNYKRLRTNLTIGYFHTDDYNSRLYTYERGVLYNLSFPCFYGKGIRLALNTRVDFTSHLMLTGKIGMTKYFDRQVIGSGLQRINGSSITDLEVQLRVKL